MEMHPDPVYEMLREIISKLDDDAFDKFETAIHKFQTKWRSHKMTRA